MKWEKRMLALAREVAWWSKDPSTKVGCVLVDDRHRVVGMGYNGYPRGVVDDVGVAREERLRRTVHAEVNAVLNAVGPVEGTTAFVTAPTCASCAGVLIQAGVKRVVWPKSDEAFVERWREEMGTALRMYAEAGVAVVEVEDAGLASS